MQKKDFLGVYHRDSIWKLDPNGRSTDFLPSNMLTQNCRFNCTYCYRMRHDLADFPKIYDDVYRFVDLVKETISNKEKSRAFFKSLNKKDLEQYRDKKHGPYITFDIGCDSDVTLDNQITEHSNYPGHIIDIINQVAEIPEAMLSFATKSTELDTFVRHVKNPKMCRIRLSLMPEWQRQILELNTAKIIDRIEAINKLVNAGFEVHINLSPIVITKSFVKDYGDLLSLLNEKLNEKAKAQLAYEIIFLTHSEKLFDFVQQFAPKAHQMMVNNQFPLEPKPNKENVLSYSPEDKKTYKQIMETLIKKHTPYARIRYMF